MKRPAVFFDRDNTLIVNDGYLGDPDGVVLVNGAAQAVALVRSLGYAILTFSNQSGVARGMFSEQDVHRVNSRLDELLRDGNENAIIDRHDFCPHHPDASVARYRQASEYRKPAPGMLYQAARVLGLDLGRSWVVGDAPRDIEAGQAAGCRTVLIRDASLKASEAAETSSDVAPDFTVVTLGEAVELIRQHTPPPAVAVSAPAEDAVLSPDAPLPAEPVDVSPPLAPGDPPEPPPAEVAIVETVEPRPVLSTAEVAATSEAFEIPPDSSAGSLANEIRTIEPTHTESTGHVSAAPAFPPELQDNGSPGSAEPEANAAAKSEAVAPELVEPIAATESAEQNAPAAVESESPAPSIAAVDPSRRRAIPAVILAAKAAREAARRSQPDASADELRNAARQAAREAAGEQVTADAPTSGTFTEFNPDYVQDESPSASIAAQTTASLPVPSPAAETSQSMEDTPPPTPVAEPAAEDDVRLALATADARLPAVAPPSSINSSRLEELAEQILLELRNRNEPSADFSVSKLMAGITLLLSLAVLVYGYFYRDGANTLPTFLLLAILLMVLTVALTIMGRQK